MGTVTKALSLLTYFNNSRPEIGLSDLTRLSGMNKATVYRMMREMQDQGFVEQAGGGRAYRLGPEVLRLASLREAAVPLLSVSREVLDALCADTGETAHMSLVRGDALITLAYRYSPAHATRVMMEDAEVLAFHATSSGLAVLAFADPEFTDRILAQPLSAHTDLTLTDPNAVRAVLQIVRASGIAESIGGFEDDVHSHAAPVFGTDRRPVGALAVAAPMARVNDATRPLIRDRVKRRAAALTRRIGGFAPDRFPPEDGR
jgi:DNA-binding IclR family transcriptional regulator